MIGKKHQNLLLFQEIILFLEILLQKEGLLKHIWIADFEKAPIIQNLKDNPIKRRILPILQMVGQNIERQHKNRKNLRIKIKPINQKQNRMN